MSAKISFGAGAILLAIAASVLVYRGLQAPERAARHPVTTAEPVTAAPVAAKSDADLARMRAELGLVQGQLRALQERMTEQTVPEAAAAVEAQEPSDGASLHERRVEDARLWKEHMAEVSAAFASEPLDRRFASVGQAAITSAFQKHPVIQAAAGKIDCRSRTCRVEIADNQSGSLDKELPLFVNSVGGTLPNMKAERVGDRSGPSTMVLYFTNEQQPVAANAR
jgi:hypothetical protein